MRGFYRTATALAVTGVVLVACTNNVDQPLAPRDSASATERASGLGIGTLPLLLPLTKSQPPAYFVCQGNGGPYTGSAVIGLLGGVVHFGPHELDVPPGALLRATTITAQTVPGDTIAVEFQPQGLKFLLPASVQLSYAQCQQQPTQALSVLYVNNLLDEVLELIQSLDNPAQHRVTGIVNHFSVYAVAEHRR